MSQTQERCVFLITGIMAAGKSTVAQLLTETFDKGVHVRGDMFRKMIVAGRDELLPNASKEALSQLSLRYRIAASVTDAYFEAGFNVVVQDVIVGSHLKEFVELIRSRPLFVVVLSPSIEVVTARESARSKKDMAHGQFPNFSIFYTMKRPELVCGLTLLNKNRKIQSMKFFEELGQKRLYN